MHLLQPSQSSLYSCCRAQGLYNYPWKFSKQPYTSKTWFHSLLIGPAMKVFLMIIQTLSRRPIFKAEWGGGKKCDVFAYMFFVVWLSCPLWNPEHDSFRQRLNRLQPPLWLPFPQGRAAELTLGPAPVVPGLGSRDSPGSSTSPTENSVMGRGYWAALVVLHLWHFHPSSLAYIAGTVVPHILQMF